MLEMVFTEIRRKAINANGENPLGAGAGHSLKTKCQIIRGGSIRPQLDDQINKKRTTEYS